MSASVLRDKSKDFANRIMACCRVLRERGADKSVVNQLLRAGTSVGANICEAQYAQGNKDFISKLEIALKEINEAEYWLDILYKNQYLTLKEFSSMRSDCIAIRRMLISSVTTLKKKLYAKL